MVSWEENLARIKEHFRFSFQELSGLVGAMLVMGFIFSFRDWDTSNLMVGFTNLILAILVAGLSIAFRISCQKLYCLTQGYKGEFKFWWAGILISLVITFITFGFVPLVMVGGIFVSFYARQRLGEFRYGFSYADNAVAALWAVWSGLILAVGGALLLYFLPQSYFFEKMLYFNLLMAFSALIPFPQLEGLQGYFGSSGLYWLALGATVLAAVLLIPRTQFGLIAAIVVGVIIAIVYLLKGSEV